MSNFSVYLANALLDNTLRPASPYAYPGQLYLALFVGSAAANLENDVVTDEVPNLYGYARTAVAFDAASASTTQNTAEVAFPTASGGSWGTVTHAAVMDGNTYGTGHVLYWAALDDPKTINDGDTFKFLLGAFTIVHQ